MPLPARIKWAREQTKLSQERFAEALGTSRRHVMRWENKGVRPTRHYVERIAEVTGQPGDLFSEDEDDEEAARMAQDLFVAIRRFVQAQRVLA
jgi:transcriptional regulator with XRE-family HTH domain